MVWGVLEPSGFGQFFPCGVFVGHTNPSGDPFRYMSDRGPVDEEQEPRVFRIERGGRTLAAWIMVRNGLLLVAREVRAVIERVEPEVHQFWPMEVVYPNGDRTAHDYHAMVIRQFRDAVIEERSEVTRFNGRPSCHATKAGVRGLTLCAERIGDAHLWRDTRLLGASIFMSDALQSAIAETGLKIMPHARTGVA